MVRKQKMGRNVRHENKEWLVSLKFSTHNFSIPTRYAHPTFSFLPSQCPAVLLLYVSAPITLRYITNKHWSASTRKLCARMENFHNRISLQASSKYSAHGFDFISIRK